MEKLVIVEALSVVGFHLIDKLLQEGIEVIGIDQVDSALKEEMVLCIGRNSQFHLQEKIDDVKADGVVCCFCEGATRKENIVDHDTKPLIEVSHDIKLIQRATHILLPPVYGPWSLALPTDKSVYVEDAIAFLYHQIEIILGEKTTEKPLLKTIFEEEGLKRLKQHQQQFEHVYKERK